MREALKKADALRYAAWDLVWALTRMEASEGPPPADVTRAIAALGAALSAYAQARGNTIGRTVREGESSPAPAEADAVVRMRIEASRAGSADEQERILDWLRSRAAGHSDWIAGVCGAIERGEHRRPITPARENTN